MICRQRRKSTATLRPPKRRNTGNREGIGSPIIRRKGNVDGSNGQRRTIRTGPDVRSIGQVQTQLAYSTCSKRRQGHLHHRRGCGFPWNHIIVRALRVNGYPHPDLFKITQTLDALGPLLGARQRRQQQRRKNGDDRNDHQQFNQGESSIFPGFQSFYFS